MENVLLQTTVIYIDCFCDCRTLPWSTKSPNLSGIGSFWGLISRRPRSFQDHANLIRQLERVWYELTQEGLQLVLNYFFKFWGLVFIDIFVDYDSLQPVALKYWLSLVVSSDSEYFKALSFMKFNILLLLISVLHCQELILVVIMSLSDNSE